MTYQYSTAVRNAKLDQIQTTVGISPVLKIFSGVEPANCATADPVGLLCTITLPVTWMNPASGGVKTLTGTWQGTITTSGTAASWRIYDSTGVICHIQGNTTDMTFSSTVFLLGVSVSVTTFQLTAANS
jgi:hypothetical protein